jgi:phosphatidate cytidylyltransferase
MLVRVISSIVASPLLLIFIIAGGVPLRCAVLFFSLVGMGEIYKAVSGKIKPVHFVGFALEVVYTYCMYKLHFADGINCEYVYFFDIMFAVIIAMLLVLMILVFGHKTNTIIDGAITIFGFFYVGILLSLICEIRNGGLIYSWLPFIFAFGSDTGAYFVGSKLGKHKLTPELSPKKSVEGAIGGVVTVILLTGIYFLVCSKLYTDITKNTTLYFIAISGVGAALSQVGDLAASSIKRFTGIKDYGKIMPGHGGVLDRFDSVLFTVPVVFFSIYYSMFTL